MDFFNRTTNTSNVSCKFGTKTFIPIHKRITLTHYQTPCSICTPVVKVTNCHAYNISEPCVLCSAVCWVELCLLFVFVSNYGKRKTKQNERNIIDWAGNVSASVWRCCRHIKRRKSNFNAEVFEMWLHSEEPRREYHPGHPYPYTCMDGNQSNTYIWKFKCKTHKKIFTNEIKSFEYVSNALCYVWMHITVLCFKRFEMILFRIFIFKS